MSPTAVGAAPAAPSTNLLSLPIEILSKIASDVAPNGGAKAGDLRLVCKALNAVATRTVMSSLHCPADSERGGELLAAILSGDCPPDSTSLRLDLDGFGVGYSILAVAFAAIRKLPGLKRLHVAGNSGEGGFLEEMPPTILAAVHNFCPALTALSIEDLDISEFSKWAPQVRNIDIINCDGWSGLGHLYADSGFTG
ncbi:hypothetical protein RQP46_007971 [Phenoliferia psychrophenolica]